MRVRPGTHPGRRIEQAFRRLRSRTPQDGLPYFLPLSFSFCVDKATCLGPVFWPIVLGQEFFLAHLPRPSPKTQTPGFRIDSYPCWVGGTHEYLAITTSSQEF